jgi:hypothetical protein
MGNVGALFYGVLYRRAFGSRSAALNIADKRRCRTLDPNAT